MVESGWVTLAAVMVGALLSLATQLVVETVRDDRRFARHLLVLAMRLEALADKARRIMEIPHKPDDARAEARAIQNVFSYLESGLNAEYFATHAWIHERIDRNLAETLIAFDTAMSGVRRMVAELKEPSPEGRVDSVIELGRRGSETVEQLAALAEDIAKQAREATAALPPWAT